MKTTGIILMLAPLLLLLGAYAEGGMLGVFMGVSYMLTAAASLYSAVIGYRLFTFNLHKN